MTIHISDYSIVFPPNNGYCYCIYPVYNNGNVSMSLDYLPGSSYDVSQSCLSKLSDFQTAVLLDDNISNVSYSPYYTSNGEFYRNQFSFDIINSSSESPDYTQILTNINTNLTNLNNKFIDGNNSNVARNLKIIASGLCSNASSPSDASETSFFRLSYNNDFLSIAQLFNKFLNIFFSTYTDLLAGDNVVRANSLIRFLSDISNKLRQSVSPNASITDVISALNATIDSKQDTTIVNNEVTPLAEINIDVPFEVKNLKKSDVEL